jgi:Subtilase family
MMNRVYKFMGLAALVLVLSPLNGSAQNVTNYILQSPSLVQAQAACQTYSMTFVSIVRDPGTYLVQTSSAVSSEFLIESVEGDPNVIKLELNRGVNRRKHDDLPYSSNAPVSPAVPPSTAVTDRTLAGVYGTTAWAAYVQQPAFYSTNIYSAGVKNGLTGYGIIGIIDTGVDPQNPILAPVLVPGYDFTQNSAGYPNDDGDLDQSTIHILHAINGTLQGYTTVQLNAFTSSILDSNTAAALQGVTLPAEYGHGTMIAGLIHLAAPTAKIMALKAFNSDGSANTSDIVRAIYYAADHGVSVLNMSFGLPTISDALMKAINYATRKGVVCIASAGNDGQTTLRYPAAFSNVIGVASVNAQNQTSLFSNRGADLVTLAAPGETLITTYPGNHYAAVSGTSFSTALVSGAADVLLFQGAGKEHDSSSIFQEPDVQRALKHGTSCVSDGSLGGGCLDLNQALQYIQSMVVPPTPDSIASAVAAITAASNSKK